LIEKTTDLYASQKHDVILSIKTYYEQQFLDQGKPISYIKFRLDTPQEIKEPDEK
jgi:tRNA (guanine-N7-)-methyltransferase